MKASIAKKNGVAARITDTATDSDTNAMTWPRLHHMAGLRSGQGRVDFADLAADGKTLNRVRSAPLPSGRYTAAWLAVSIDTHSVAGRFLFTVK